MSGWRGRALDRLVELHKEKHGEDDRGPYVICDYDKTHWPCLTQRIIDEEREGE